MKFSAEVLSGVAADRENGLSWRKIAAKLGLRTGWDIRSLIATYNEKIVPDDPIGLYRLSQIKIGQLPTITLPVR